MDEGRLVVHFFNNRQVGREHDDEDEDENEDDKNKVNENNEVNYRPDPQSRDELLKTTCPQG